MTTKTITILLGVAATALISGTVFSQQQNPVPPPPSNPAEMETFHWINENVLRLKDTGCIECHGRNGDPSFDASSYEGVMQSVTKLDPDNSPFMDFQSDDANVVGATGDMPQNGSATQDQVSAVYYWIKNGADNN